MITITDPMNQLDDITNIEKYRAGGKLVGKVLGDLVAMCKPGIKTDDICRYGDTEMTNALQNVFQNIEYKGICFPTCVSINNVAGHFTGSREIHEGDLVKIELGCHIDGFPAVICYTVFVNNGEPIGDKRANVLRAVYECSREVFGLMKPGILNTDIVKSLEKYAKKYNCNIPCISDTNTETMPNIERIPGVQSYQMGKYVIDGHNECDDVVYNTILNRHQDIYEFNMVELELEENEVYCIDITMSTGTGKLTNDENITTIVKRNICVKHMLKLNAAKQTLNSFNNCPFPINIKDCDTRFKFGLKECVTHGLVEEYPIMREKDGEFIARVKFTVIVQDKPILITGRSADEELNKLIKIQPLSKNQRKKIAMYQ